MRRTNGILSLIVVVTLLLVAMPVGAQTPTRGEVSGIITDRADAAVPGATVQLVARDSSRTWKDFSNSNGSYAFISVAPGIYDLVVYAPGFARSIVSDLVVQVGRLTKQNVRLEVATLRQEIRVTASSSLLQSERSELGEVIERRRIESLPLKNREFSDLATLVPQVVRTPPIEPTKVRIGNIGVGGTGGRQSNVLVDGLENFDTTVGGRAFDVTTEGMQEFNVITARFTAQQARSAGALINIVQLSGSNDVHGSLFYFFRNQGLTARDTFQIAKTRFRRQQQGITLGGPFRKDRSFGFLAFEDQRELDNGVVNTNGVFPQFEGSEQLPFRRDLVTVKIDEVMDSRQRIFYRMNLDVFAGEENVGGINARSAGRSISTTVQSHVFSHSYLRSPTKINTISAQALRSTSRLIPFSEQPEQRRPSLVIGRRAGDPQGTFETRFQIGNDFSLAMRRHNLKMGGEFHRLWVRSFFDFATRGSFTFFYDAPLEAEFADLMIISRCNRPNCQLAARSTNVYGLYFHDDWKILPNLTLNLGIRWDFMSNENNNGFDGALGLLAPPGSRRADKNNFSPRIGFAWDPFRRSEFVIRGGYGIYYQNVNFNDALIESGLDGRNIAFRVFFDPGRINVANPFPGLTPAQIDALILGPPQVPFVVLQNGFRSPYFQYWSAGFHAKLASDFVFSLDGVHMLGLKGLVTRDINVDSQFNLAAPEAPLCVERGAAVCQQFGPVPFASNMDRLHYNALVASLNKRFPNLGQMSVSYTLSKAENVSRDSVGAATPVPNPFDAFDDFGPANTDQRQRLIFNGIFDPSRLPLFWGRDWELAIISYFGTPLPFDLLSGSPALDGISPVRPLGLSRNNGNRGSQQRVLQLVNAFRVSKGLSPLNRRLVPRSMNIRSTDIRISKLLRLNDRLRLRIQGEVFNLFNHANYISNGGNGGFGSSGINGIVESDTVGMPTATPGVLGSGGPRAIQLALRLQF